MPFLHRLACFRDDLVFLIFLYQVSNVAVTVTLSTDTDARSALDIPNRP